MCTSGLPIFEKAGKLFLTKLVVEEQRPPSMAKTLGKRNVFGWANPQLHALGSNAIGYGLGSRSRKFFFGREGRFERWVLSSHTPPPLSSSDSDSHLKAGGTDLNSSKEKIYEDEMQNNLNPANL
ncbi:hypothetical protein TNCV_310511 [Trichonephila clavipes]|nr:hypothetical protein TNCV_310511 [Trichonephila clavipes]